jgi:hypothetical protein
MPRKNNGDRPEIKGVNLPGYAPSKRGDLYNSEDNSSISYGRSVTKKDYLETGLGRSLDNESVENLLSILGMCGVKKINRSGVVYLAGNEMARRVNYGSMPGRLRIRPHDAIEVLTAGLLAENGFSTEQDSISVDCRGFGVKEFGSTALKITVHLSDSLDSQNEPILLSERIRFMDMLEVDQKPSVKPFDLITHHADLGVVEGYSLSKARELVRNAHGPVSHQQATLMPVGSVSSILPDNWT